jgi:hypothetical protein
MSFDLMSAVRTERLPAQTNKMKNCQGKRSARGTRNTSARLFAFKEGCATYYFLLRSMGIGSQTSNTKMRSARLFWASLNSSIR